MSKSTPLRNSRSRSSKSIHSCKHSANGDMRSRRSSNVRPSSASNRNSSRAPPVSTCCNSYLQPNDAPEELTSSGNADIDYLQCKVGSLRKKLNEANNNICTLRAFVVGTLVRLKNPKDPTEMAEEIKQVICAIDEMEDHICAVLGRGVECVEVLDDLETFGCTCATESPSLSEIRNELVQVNNEMEAVDKALTQCQKSADDEMSYSTRGSRGSRKESVSAGTQRFLSGPEKKPKILQTGTRLSVTEGTNVNVTTQSAKAQTAKPRCTCVNPVQYGIDYNNIYRAFSTRTTSYKLAMIKISY
ncbi:hypothetical protein FQR65_LT09737 [Abscondita terminalis]|nr:hypothetical protein FQR65_LT09737 [Abscondita terminalis]